MLSFRTTGFNGYAVKYSPFFDSRIACAASSNFGLVGNGRLYILTLTPQGIIAEKWFDTQDSLFDVSFSESNANQLAAASGDGSIKLFDATLADFPIRQWREHTREVFSLSWNLVDKNIFASSSWDGNIKIWSPTSPASLRTIHIGSCTYSVAFQPSSPTVLSAVSSDGFMRVFDLRAPEPSAEIAKTRVSPGEVLTQDWNKYRASVIASAGVDRGIRIWDLKMPGICQTELVGHEYAVRRIAWSPHWQDVVLSASYDMSVRVWTDGSSRGAGGTGLGGAGPGGGRLMGVMDKHTEFCAGVDWCLFGGEGWAASTGWDEMVWVWDVGGVIGSR
ncbi:WD40 repeat-like protein [Wilcoxina mikolae CBS 423.85]|nr:WD40 repeat-like protein [Wilcoxina mikolae CBS 423.85]